MIVKGEKNEDLEAADNTSKRSKQVVSLWDDTYKEYSCLLTEMEEDFRFMLGDQWNTADKATLGREGRPVLSINTCKKACDIITGYQKSNFADITVLPVENTDQDTAQIYTELMKWIMAQKLNKTHVSYAFSDAVTCGLGWITCDIKYDRDFVNGDIVVGHGSPFSILPDPLFKEPDLSDARYVLRYSWLSKDDVKALYPDAQLKELREEQPDAEYIQQPKAKGGKRVLVIEKWYRDYTTKTIYIDPETQNIYEVDVNDPLSEAQILADYPAAKKIRRNVPTIKLITVTHDGEILYDGDHPHGTSNYPFFPVFGYFTPTFNELDLRVQGMIRILKDPQREKNKRRSQMMYSVMSMPYGGLLVEKGFVDDPNEFNTRKGGMKIIEYNPGKQFKQLQPQDMPNALLELEQMSDQDMRMIGVNPDLLGDQMSKSEPGINIQLRQKQGMTAIQEFFSNLSAAKKALGCYVIELINENFTDTKVSRIVGYDVPQGFIEKAKDIYFDTAVDEVADSPTARMATFTTLSNLRQQGAQIPDEIMIELLEGVTKETKEKILEPMRMQRELLVKQLQDQLNPPPPMPTSTGEPMPGATPEGDPSLMQAPPVDPNTGMPIDPNAVPQEMV